ncbi:MAG: two-component system response regulator [Methylothermaceae bacteria B42]|nr:MAG: two-component system response regulator [Methylothermaceae bacteria B42]HHJ39087.1 response regulator [Methylothermaceae bacterium]
MESLAIEDLALLLVEPSTSQAKIILNRLHEQGVDKVEISRSGQETLQLLSSFVPDLVISSMYLPDMTAVQLLTKIRNDPSLHQLPFLLVSSESHIELLDPVRQAGVVAILPKPFDSKDLTRALRTTLQYLDPEEIQLETYDIENLRILLVDDSRMARKHIHRVLNDMGIENITEAKDGKEAAEILSQQEFDLIITDYNMPEMDGRELTCFIRRELNNPFLPIIMVTSEQNTASLSSVQQAGVSAICDKPFEPQNVKELLYRCLEES